VYAGAALAGRVWRRLKDSPRRLALAAGLASLLVGIWVAQFAVRDWPHAQRLLGLS
jgi:hypothetical protein